MLREGPTARRGDIQGLRAVAVVIVVLYHADAGFGGGFVGVDVFFVISGYVIARSLLTELNSTGSIDLKRFYLRRVRRLLPALAIMLGAVLVAASYLSPIGGQRSTAITGVAAALFNANHYLATLKAGYFDVALESNALLHTWSLSIEEQFYFVFPALLLVGWRLRLPGRRITSPIGGLWTILGTAAAASLGLTLFLVYLSGRGSSDAFYLAPARAWEFIAGAVIALAATRLQRIAPLPGAVLTFSGAGLVLWATFSFDADTVFPGLAVMLPVAGSVLLIAGGEVAPTTPITRLLAWRPLRYIGDLSYSWYLWHWPAIVFARAWFPTFESAALFGAAASLAPAILSYHFVEESFRHEPSVTTRQTLRLASASITLPLIASIAVLVSMAAVQQRDHLEPFDRHGDFLLGCDSRVPLGQRGESECETRLDGAIGTAVLIGDSQAGQLTEGFLDAFGAHEYSTTLATSSNCPFVDLIVVDGTDGSEACHDFVTGTVAALVEAPPDVVVLATDTKRYLDRHPRLIDPATGEMVTETADAWEAAFLRVVEPLADAGIEVILVHPIPRYGSWDPRGCAVAIWEWAPKRCQPEQSVVAARAATKAALLIEARVVATAEVIAIDPFPLLCDEGRCRTRDADGWIMRDYGHISVAKSLEFAAVFEDTIAGIVIDAS